MDGATIAAANAGAPGLLDRARIVAGPGFNRWLVPPAALAIHLCIGMAYGFSVFWLPLTRQVGTPAPADASILTQLFTTTVDWRVSDLAWLYILFFVFLGSSAAIWGGWLERAGPRRAGVYSALLWCGGICIAALGVYAHQLWMLWLFGVVGGIGLGLGYISPVSTLVKWFPDRRGMATGMAIMGFGGGALIGSPLANLLMNHYGAGVAAKGVVATLLTMAAIYVVFMLAGAFGYRVPPENWAPEGWTPPVAKGGMITRGNVHLRDVHKTPQFWMLWVVLCMNVSAGIGVLGVASPMLQQIFGGRLIGLPDVGFPQLTVDQARQVATVAAGFVGLLSLFNIVGRFFWASTSDRIGRKTTYFTFFLLGIALYAGSPFAAGIGSVSLFVLFMCVIMSMYGGGFATIPAYLADVFGPKYVGAIHGRLLTAWSTAGVLGPFVITKIPEMLVRGGMTQGEAYNNTLYICSGFLVIGLIANAMVRPVSERWHMTEASAAGPAQAAAAPVMQSYGIGRGGVSAPVLLAWTFVGVPLAWGFWKTLQGALVLFR